MRIKGIRHHARRARHGRGPATGRRRQTPSCGACGYERVEEVRSDVLRSHQQRWQP